MWQRVLPKLFVGLMAIVGIFGIGSYWRSGEKPLNVSTKQLTANSPGASKNSTNQPAPINTNSSVQPVTPSGNVQSNKQFAPQSANLTTKPPAKQTEPAPLSAEETVYYCGAMTKKGTLCSRRVKGGGRCWQHKGQNALLPPEKLLASQ
ncbi:MAG: hypothetical protein ABJA66_17240 [Actinomycetota bacterium]